MAETSWPSSAYNSSAVSDIEYEELAFPYTANGVIGKPGDSPMVFADNTGMHVKVRQFTYGHIRGHLYSSGTTDAPKTIASNGSGSIRIDLAVLEWNRSTKAATVVIVEGTPGSGTPTPTVNTGATGVYQIVLAKITVTPGDTSIDASQVVWLGWYVGRPPIVCTSATRPPHAVGQVIFQTDGSAEFISDGTNWLTRYTDTGWNAVAAKSGSGWDATGSYIRNRNGITSLRLVLIRTGGDLQRGTLSAVGNVSGVYWPSAVGDPPRTLGYFLDADDKVDDPKHDITDTSNGGILAECYLNSAGVVNVYSNAKISQGDTVRFSCLTFPAG